MTSGLEESSDTAATIHRLKGNNARGNSALSSLYTFFRLQRLDFFGVGQCLLMETGMCVVGLATLKN